MRKIEKLFESALFASRWLLAPLFAGLALSLLLVLYKFAVELWHAVLSAAAVTGTQLIAEILGLVDLCLVASLLVIVVLSGYESFVSRIDHSEHRDWPEWIASIDFTGLKLKVLSSIVAISAVQLLRAFLAVEAASDRELAWTAGIHITFVVSTLLLALSDRVGAGSGHVTTTPVPAADKTSSSP